MTDFPLIAALLFVVGYLAFVVIAETVDPFRHPKGARSRRRQRIGKSIGLCIALGWVVALPVYPFLDVSARTSSLLGAACLLLLFAIWELVVRRSGFVTRYRRRAAVAKRREDARANRPSRVRPGRYSSRHGGGPRRVHGESRP